MKRLRQIQKKIFAAAVFAAVLLACPAGLASFSQTQTVYAASVSYTTVNVSSVSELKSALSTAAEKATSTKQYKIIVAAGTYSIDSVLYIPSNTYIYAVGATFNQVSGASMPMLRTGEDATDIASAEGYCYKNITIEGGTWNMNGNDKTLFQICHAKNVTVKNATFKNVCNGHLMEVAGVNGLTIYNCTFEDQELNDDAGDKTTYEAIQIDILQEDHLVGYAQEDLANKDIEITYCDFEDVPRGIGSHTAVLNNPINGLTIDHCTFDGVGSAAIQLMAVKNCTISNNTIKDAARGIFIYTYRTTGTFLSTTLDSSATTSTSYKTPTDYNIVISNNTITLNSSDDAYDSWQKAAVLVGGLSLSSATEGATGITGNKIPKGNYYITGVTISGNTIKTPGHGIRLSDARGTTVSGNTITYTGTASSKYYGISAYDASKGIENPIVISSNTIKNSSSSKKIYRGIFIYSSSSVQYIDSNTIGATRENGIFVYDSGNAKYITGNTITSSGKYGISISTSSKGQYIKNNTIKSSSDNGIFIYNSSSATTISGNTVTSAGKNGIMISTGSTATNIKSNTIKSASNNGIYVYSKSTATSINSNTISSSGKYGISVYGTSSSRNSTVTNVKNNTISSCTSYGIDIQSIKNAVTVSGNTIKSCTAYSIRLYPQTTSYRITVSSNTITGKSKKYVGIYATQATVTVKSNTIKSCSYPVQFTTTVKGSIYKNTLSSNSYNKYKIGSSTSGNLSAPTLTVSTKTKSSIKLKWTKVSGTGYQLYRATSKSGDYSKIKTVSSASTLTYTNSSLTKSTTYYYKIRAYKKISNTTIYSPYSSIVSGKTKSS